MLYATCMSLENHKISMFHQIVYWPPQPDVISIDDMEDVFGCSKIAVYPSLDAAKAFAESLEPGCRYKISEFLVPEFPQLGE